MQKRATHAGQIKAIFAVLAALILAAHASSVLLFGDVVRVQEAEVQQRLRHTVGNLLQVWQSRPLPLEAVDSLVVPLVRSGLVAAAWIADCPPATGWRVRRFGDLDLLAAVLRNGSPADSGQPVFLKDAPFSNTEYQVAGWTYRTYSTAGTLGQTPVIVGAVTPIPSLARLRTIWRWDLGLRAAVTVLFAWFSLQFFRLILRPYQKMRAQAERLSGTGLLPGPQSDDVEYVMEAFASAVERLTRQREDLQWRFDRSERRYESLEKFNTYILDSMSAGVLILDQEGAVLRLNPSARRILNLEAFDIRGQPYTMLQQRYPELAAVLDAGLRDSRVYQRQEITIKFNDHPSGERYLGITTSLIYNDREEVVGISVLLTDLTEIKRLQADLENNQRLADLGEMAAGLAHQLRNSMTAIVGFGRLLQRKIAPDDPAKNTIGDVLQEARESEEMLERFLNFARPLNVTLQPCSLAEIIEKAQETVKAGFAEHQTTIAVQYPPRDDRLQADPLLLRQVFVNLFQNAAEAMSEGGRIDVRILPPAGSEEEAGRWLVRVGDTGPGIPGADHERIFQPFVTSKERGTGLGLPIARKIVSAHGGYLSVESSTPAGTVFLLRLPHRPISTPVGGPREQPAPAG